MASEEVENHAQESLRSSKFVSVPFCRMPFSLSKFVWDFQSHRQVGMVVKEFSCNVDWAYVTEGVIP